MQSGEDDEAAQRDALRMPDPDAPPSRADENYSQKGQTDIFIPLLAIGSFAAFALIIGSEYLTRGICPPFLDTCINLLGGADDQGWGS